jgi:hypothetical protein
MDSESQNYKNHARLRPPFHFFVLPVLLVNVLVQVWVLWGTPALGTLWALVVAVALLMTALLARTQALTAQDRLIRLEMQLRLRGLLPADLQKRVPELSPQHLVALRFASDAEMPDLVREVLAGSLKTQKEIKMRIRDWQGDWLRV